MGQQTTFVHGRVTAQRTKKNNQNNPLNGMDVVDLPDYIQNQAVGLNPQTRDLLVHLSELIIENRLDIENMEQ